MGFSGLKSTYWQGCVPSGGSRGESVPCLLQILEAAPFLGSWPHMAPTSVSFVTFPSLTGPSCIPLMMDIGPTQIIHVISPSQGSKLNPICRVPSAM